MAQHTRLADLEAVQAQLERLLERRDERKARALELQIDARADAAGGGGHRVDREARRVAEVVECRRQQIVEAGDRALGRLAVARLDTDRRAVVGRDVDGDVLRALVDASVDADARQREVWEEARDEG